MKKLQKKLFNRLKQMKQSKKKGFTLIEMVVVIAIIVILLIIVAPNLAKQRETAENKSKVALKQTVETQVELYRVEHNETPKGLSELVNEGMLTKDQVEKFSKYGYEYQDSGKIVDKNGKS